MKKYLKFIILCNLVILLLGLIGCTFKGESTAKAIYLAPKSGGQLTDEDIKRYPEVIRVTSFNELKELASKNTSIWIDKDAVDLLDLNWLQEEEQSRIPIVLIGYNNALYSFREKLDFGIQGPKVDWSKQKLETGFSVWMLKEKSSQSRSAFMKGYDTTPETKQILSITNMLLEGKFPE